MPAVVDSPYLVPFDDTFSVASAPTAPPGDAPAKAEAERRLAAAVERLADLQRQLYAQDRWAVLLVFQAMDAAGKDGTIRAILSGVDPSGCHVTPFKAPTHHELDHDFLWRHVVALPQRGIIGVFNRSWYEEVLAVRVHPEYLDAQRLPELDRHAIWAQRLASIRDLERHLRRNGTLVLKFWLNIGKDEQRRRLLARIDDPKKRWKFQEGDVAERARWDAYMDAYERALRATSRPEAPWYAIPADDKTFLRMTVVEIVVAALESLELRWPELPPTDEERLAAIRAALAADD